MVNQGSYVTDVDTSVFVDITRDGDVNRLDSAEVFPVFYIGIVINSVDGNVKCR